MKRGVLRQRFLIIRNVAPHRQVVAGGAAYAAAGFVAANIHLFCPCRLRETINQALAILPLIFGAEIGIRLAAMIAGADTVLLILGVLRCQIAVIT